MRMLVVKEYTPGLCHKHPQMAFLFDDNWSKFGSEGTAIIRGARNAFGIPVKKYPSRRKDAYLTDNDFEANKKRVDAVLERVLESGYKVIVVPEGGLGAQVGNLREKSPRNYMYIVNALDRLVSS